ncbi:MAG: hypothetical protein ABJC12_10545 [Saprospiraceae bacterium]
MKNGISCVMLIMLMTLASNILSAQTWDYLGSAKVQGVGVDHDEILVTRMEGDFKAIKILVENEGIEFEKVVVHFGNGGQQELAIRDFIPAGSETRVLDLNGRDRIIHSVEFYYKSNPATRKKGKVKLYGRR